MPQNPRKVRQMINVTGIKPPVYAGNLYTVTGGVATLVGKAQYISKGVSGSWPGPGWHVAPEELPPEVVLPEEEISPPESGQLPQRPTRPTF
jgi:hypothetical protein